ncbi:Panacea domain-containing protein [Haloferula sargassicola]|uniref:Antitoxin SocA-like Panacea domain-containing protein n=1 Tax=Haloferula sargassicola TaxID=490096 RepID=A0ABP9UYZ2_9BACT
MNLTFAHRKATQALNFFARKEGGRMNKLKALKLVYFADRCHLRRYGRPITNDRYLAMEYGPVASSCKDLAEMSEFLGKEETAYAQRFLSPAGHDYTSAAEVDVDEFSQTDLEALEFAWIHYGRRSPFDLADETHKFPEWKRHEARFQSPYESWVPMAYGDFFENPPEGVDQLPPLSPDEQADLREQLEELHSVESLWR